MGLSAILQTGDAIMMDSVACKAKLRTDSKQTYLPRKTICTSSVPGPTKNNTSEYDVYLLRPCLRHVYVGFNVNLHINMTQ